MKLSQEQRDALFAADLANIAAKVESGAPLTARERDLIDDNTDAAPASQKSGAVAAMSVNQLAALTGKDRRTITERLKELPFEPGPKKAHLYKPDIALAAIYAANADGTSLEAARTRQAVSQAVLNERRCEELARTRIPIEIVSGIWNAALSSFGATLKAARGKVLSAEKINELLDIMRKAKLPTTW